MGNTGSNQAEPLSVPVSAGQLERPPRIIFNRKYKDSFFAALFNDRHYAVEIYRELHPEDADIADEDIQVVTLKNIFTIDYYNDACILAGERLMVLTEHQSSINRNMPTRMLLYIVEEYKRIFDNNKKLMHTRKLVKIPAPEFYVIYTGKEECPDKMYLSEAFQKLTGALELTVTVISSPSKGGVIGEFISFTREIASLIEQTRDKLGSIRKVVEKYKNGTYKISDFLKKKEDAVDMISEGITLEEAIQIELEDAKDEAREEGWKEGREEGREEGRKEGREEGLEEGLEKGMEKGLVLLVDALLTCGQSPEQAFHMAARQYGKEIAAVENVYHTRKKLPADATRDANAVI